MNGRQRTALISGANSGIGYELTKRLLQEDWNVIALIRSDFADTDSQIVRALAQQQLRVYKADLSDYTSLQHALHEINQCEPQIDVLFNNAAAAISGIRHSPQGREMHFEVNTVVPYIVLMELKPLLLKGDLKTVVNISSNALLFVKQFDLETLQHPTRYIPLSGPYGASKLGLSLWTQALAPQLLAEGIEIRSVNPGGNKTKMTERTSMPKWLLLIRHLFFSHPSVGAGRVYDAAFGRWRGTTGIFINNGKATPFKFSGQGRAVLEAVNQIYQEAFLSQLEQPLESSLKLAIRSL